jgi:hypothetical protein
MAYPWNTPQTTTTNKVSKYPWSDKYVAPQKVVPPKTAADEVADERKLLTSVKKADVNTTAVTETEQRSSGGRTGTARITPPTVINFTNKTATDNKIAATVQKPILDVKAAVTKSNYNAPQKALEREKINAKYNIGEEFTPIYKDESAETKVLKGLLNYGLGSVTRTIGGLGDFLATTAKAIVNTIEGKPLPGRTTPCEMLPDNIKAELDAFEKNNPTIGKFVKSVIGGVLDPATIIGGMGVYDDLLRAGIVGKSARLGTTENLLVNAKAGEKAAASIAKGAGTSTVPVQTPVKTAEPFITQEGKSILPDTGKVTEPIKPIISDTVAMKVEPTVAKSATVEYKGLPITKEGGKFVAKTDQGDITATTLDTLKRKIDTANSNPKVEPLKAETPKATDKVRSWLEQQDADATKTVQDFFNPADTGIEYMRAGLPGEVLTALVKKGAAKLAIKTLDFAEWSAEMIQELGEKVRPYLDDVWAKAHDLLKSADDVEANAKIKTFAETPKGDLPAGEVERGFSRNIRTDANMPDEIRQAFDEQPLGYKQKSNVATLDKAEKVMENGQAEAISRFYEMLHDNKYNPETVPLAKLIAKNANAAGDTATARQILSDVAVKLTEAGQFSQAAKILRNGDPETFLLTVQKQLNKLNKEGLKVYKKKWNEIKLTDDEIAKIGKIKEGDDAAYETMMNEIHDRIAKEVPSNAWEKFDAWRRIAMLFNPTTHIRNIGGNVLMGGMQRVSDAEAAILERVFVPKADRTKSFLWRNDAERVRLVNQSWEANKRQLMKNGRWDLETNVGTLRELNSMKPIFKTKALANANKITMGALNIEDNIFVKTVYKNSLGGFLKARGLKEVTDEAIEYATRRAYEATFKQANWLATTINGFKKIPVAGRFGEAAVPFSKTPSNIVMRAFEYSPAGIMKALYSGAAHKGASMVIEDLSKSLTGVGIVALGLTLASAGWAKGSSSTSNKAEAFKVKKGEQSYSIITPFGSYTIDWAQPFAVPFFIGVTMYEEFQKPKYEGKTLEAVLNSLYKGGDTIIEMSMLRNIKALFGAGSTTEKISGLVVSYIEQAIPTLVGKIARSVDPNVRETYDPNPAKEEWNKIIAKMPGLSMTLPEKVDNFGEVVKNNNVWQQMLSPGYAKAKDERPFMKEIERLYNIDNDTDIIPSAVDGTFKYKGKDIIMTADEYTTFKKRYGNIIMNGIGEGESKMLGLSQLVGTEGYNALLDKWKVKRIKHIYDVALKQAKYDMLKRRGIDVSMNKL